MNLDNYNQLIGTGIDIYGSREKIRSQLVDFAKEYLELKTVDFYKTSVMSYIVDTLSILSANHLFYDSVIYREFFMVEAQMQESVYNLVRWIGYEVPKAVPSRVDAMFTIPLTFAGGEVRFNIPNTFQAYAGDTIFTIDTVSRDVASSEFYAQMDKVKEWQADPTNPDFAAIVGHVINNRSLTVKDSSGFFRPIFLSDDAKYASFSMSFTQHQRLVFQFLVPSNIQAYQFFSKVLDYIGMISNIKVWVAEAPYNEKIILNNNPENFDPNTSVDTNSSSTVEWNEWTESPHGIYTMAPGDKSFVFVGGINRGELFFGNGIIGRQPPPNSAITVELYITKGEDGHIIPYSLTQGDKIYYTKVPIYDEHGHVIGSDQTSRVFGISFQITNPVHSQGGENTPTLPEIKKDAIINLRSKQRLVSILDYDDINSIMDSSFPSVEGYPILKRSDIKVNEIMLFLRLMYHDENYMPQIVPTRNVKFPVYDPIFVEDKYTILRTTKMTVDNEDYETLYNITIDEPTMMAYYDYILQNVIGSPVALYEEREYSWYQQYVYMPMNTIDFNIELPENLNVSSSSSSSGTTSIYPLRVKANVNYIPNDDESEDYKLSDFRCTMVGKWGSLPSYTSPLITEVISGTPQYYFEFDIPNYLDVPVELQRFEFNIDGYGFLRDKDGNFIDEFGNIIDIHTTAKVEGWMPLYKYYCDVMVRKDLSDVMFSTVTKTSYWDGVQHSSVRYDVHNVPTILSSYLDMGDGVHGILNRADNQQYPNFEITVMQNLLRNLDLTSKRMLTDSINIKFPDTHGYLNNMKYNPVDYIVKSRYHTPFKWEPEGVPPGIIFVEGASTSSSSSGTPTGTERYIVNGEVPGYSDRYDLASYIDDIAELYRNAGPSNEDIWYLIKPKRGMLVRVEDELDETGREKILVYDGDGWKDVQTFFIPLNIKMRISMDPLVTIDDGTLKDNIKEALVNHFSPYMGTQKELDRSEIIQVVRDVKGVIFGELLQPEVDIRFKYDIRKDLTQEELLDYTPQYVGFTKDTIEIDVT